MEPHSIESVLSNESPWHIEVGDCIDVLRQLPAGCVQCCVTSPPYWGLRDYGVDGQLGLEATPEQYVGRMVEVFAEVRRVLRDDGTLWLNIGDSYAAGAKNRTEEQATTNSNLQGGLCGQLSILKQQSKVVSGLKPKDLVGIPWQLAFALRADGWYLRSEIIWHKKAPMPESVTDRPTKAHEQVFLLTKSARYFYDEIASAEQSIKGAAGSTFTNGKTGINGMGRVGQGERADDTETRNMRSVWTLSPESFSGAHFATMPTELARRCILAGTSEMGCCPMCGAPWGRIVVRNNPSKWANSGEDLTGGAPNMGGNRQTSRGLHRDPGGVYSTAKFIGWKPTCDCNAGAPVPCLVYDPFNGAATTGLVARQLGCRYLGSELNPEYADMGRARIAGRGGVPGLKPLPGQLDLFGSQPC